VSNRDRYGRELPPLAPAPESFRRLIDTMDTMNHLNTRLEAQVERLARRARLLLAVAVAQAVLSGALAVLIAADLVRKGSL
jgi:hypothetical protein